jgi:hypothetical protein
MRINGKAKKVYISWNQNKTKNEVKLTKLEIEKSFPKKSQIEIVLHFPMIWNQFYSEIHQSFGVCEFHFFDPIKRNVNKLLKYFDI